MLRISVQLLQGYHYRSTQCATWRLGGMPDWAEACWSLPTEATWKVPACDGPLLLHEVAQAKSLLRRGEETAVSTGSSQEADL